ncbi:hypothetical protein NMG60_11033170 [Bertholletia excelsa]
MASSKSYYPRANYRFLPSDQTAPVTVDSMFELDESEVWNSARSSSPEFRRAAPSSRVSKKPSSKRSSEAASSLPVNVPDWSKILKDDYKDNRRRDFDEDDTDYDGNDGDGNRIPPHEFLARQLARTRIASFSVHEGVGRTLKGRDLSRVRNAIWEKTGFQD